MQHRVQETERRQRQHLYYINWIKNWLQKNLYNLIQIVSLLRTSMETHWLLYVSYLVHYCNFTMEVTRTQISQSQMFSCNSKFYFAWFGGWFGSTICSSRGDHVNHSTTEVVWLIQCTSLNHRKVTCPRHDIAHLVLNINHSLAHSGCNCCLRYI
jgi:hypothetical protein